MSANDHNSRDEDPVWDLLDQVPPAQAGPMFARNVMREIRLAGRSPAPWWKRLLAPVPLAAGAVTVAAVFAVIVASGGHAPAVSDNPDSPAPPAAAPYDVEQRLLIAAAEEPSLVSDEELLALLY